MGLGILTGMLTVAAQATPMDIDKRFTDREFFEKNVDLTFDGLDRVKAAVDRGDYRAARHALAEYYRSRRVKTRFGDPRDLGLTAEDRVEFAEWGRKLLDHEVLEGYWTGPFTIDWWHAPNADKFARMYWWDNLAKAYVARNFDAEIARTWVGLLRSFVAQCPPPENGKPDLYWEGLKGGIRLRRGWPLTFHVFVDSDQVTDDDIVVFLKSLIEQGEFIRRTHWPVGNKITFAMVGLYSAGTAFPELKLAPVWREYALSTALKDLGQGYLPDGMGVELSPGYHNLFYNYLILFDIARKAGRGDEPQIQQLANGCERLFQIYPKLAAPDRHLPRYQDGGSPNAKERLAYALEYYPDNALFQWFATDGASGTPPAFRSVALPYAGYIAMRTGWERDAVYVGFDVGPVGLGHAHQDKLNLVMWAYGRMLLMDPAHGNYRGGDFSSWARDTFAHNTALVDNRPQRRRWGKSGGFMPDKPLTDYIFETQENWDRASGVYDGDYGLPGPSESYPYARGGNFHDGWGRPAIHHRRVFFLHPDIVVVSDVMLSRDGQPHEYEIRWNLDSEKVSGADEAGIVMTRDEGVPNMVVAPLDTLGLTVERVSARRDPPILGWNFYDRDPRPATTVRHLKFGPDTIRFVTLLLSVRADSTLSLDALEHLDGQTMRFSLSDRRRFEVTVPADPTRNLSVVAAYASNRPATMRAR